MSESGIVIDPMELRRLTRALRQGYEDAMPEVTDDFARGFARGMETALHALERIAATMEDA